MNDDLVKQIKVYEKDDVLLLARIAE